ncbi:hypothetical protein HU200_025606 [Digitaria exilis]|uniref:Strictosidine synthase conserved region domain-containing protein n=1 Tax=Digitaria exilis TaxID=1010633 RepID=A0A835C4W5_9POAL|nr:hypothetical protein HU200_025606 [Digitaria exilis]
MSRYNKSLLLVLVVSLLASCCVVHGKQTQATPASPSNASRFPTASPALSAYLGLMKVGPSGGEATVLATEADGVPFNFVNGVDVDQVTGDVYFTDSSTTYTWEHNTMILINRDTTGRLLKYDTRRRRVVVLRSGLPYPNGVAVSADRTHVVVAHTGPRQAFRYWLKGPKAGHYELLATSQ